MMCRHSSRHIVREESCAERGRSCGETSTYSTTIQVVVVARKMAMQCALSLGIGEMGNIGVSMNLRMSTSLLLEGATHRSSPCSFRLPLGCRRQCPIFFYVSAACG